MNSKLKLNLLTIADILLVAICTLDAYEFLPNEYFLTNISKLLCIIYVSIIVYDLIYTSFNIKNYIFSFLLVTITLISTIYGERLKLLIITLLVLSFKNINYEKFIARDTIIRTLETIIVILLYIYNNDFVIHPAASGERLRYALGLGHPNILGFTLTTISMELMYLSRKNWSCLLAYGFSAFTIWFNIYYISSRTALIVQVFATLCFIVLKIFPKILKFKPFQFLIENSYLLLTILSFIAIYLFAQGNDIAIKLNDLFSTRLYLANQFIDYYGITLFGTTVSDWFTTPTGVTLNFFDMGFAHTVIKYGIIGWGIYAIFYNRMFHYLFKKGNYNLPVLILSFLVSGLMERYIFKAEFFSIAGILGLWLGDNEKKEEKYPTLNTHIITISSTLLILFVCAWLIFYNNTPSLLSDGLNVLNNQYELLISLFKNINSPSTLSFNIGLNTNIYSLLSNNVLSPFNIALPILNIINSRFNYFYFYAFKVGLASLFTSLWLSKLTNKRGSIVLVSLLYSFSCVLLVSFATNFIDIYCFLPLVLFFIERNIQNNKKICFVISLLFISLINEIYIIPVLILLVLYLLFRSLYLNKTYKETITFTLETILVPLCLSFIIIPCLTNYSGIITNRDDVYGKLAILLEPINLNNTYSLSKWFSFGSFILVSSIFFINDKKTKILSFLYILISCALSMCLSLYYGQASYILLIISYITLLPNLLDNYKLSNFIFGLITYLTLFVIYIIITYLTKADLSLEKLSTLFTCFALVLLALLAIHTKKLGAKTINLFIIFEIATCSINMFVVNQYLTQKSDLNSVYVNSTSDEKLSRTINLSNGLDYTNQGDSTNTTINDHSLDYGDNVSFVNLLKESQSNEYLGYKKNLISYYNISGVKYILNNIDNTEPSNEYYLPENVTNTKSLAQLNKGLLANDVYIIRYKESQDSVLSIDENNNVILAKYDGSTSQLWRVTHDDNGFITIINLSNNKVLDLNNSSLDNGTIISLFDSNGGSNQKWVAIPRNDGIELITSLSLTKAMNVTNNNVDINDYINQLWEFECLSDQTSSEIPSYYQKVDTTYYYENPYYIELGYVNNKTINADFLVNNEQFFDAFTREEILREYVAIENDNNTTYELIDNPDQISDYIYDSYYEQNFEDPLSNTTIVIKNGSIPIIDIDLYYNDKLVKTKHFYQYDFCSIQIDDELVDKIVINSKDIDESYTPIIIYTIKNSNEIEEKLYKQRINNSFTNITYSNHEINADINISDDDSLVYTYIPYDNNWIIAVDGQEVEMLKANYGFVAFKLNKGNHKVVFTYKYNNTLPIVVSVASLICFIALEIVNKKHKIS